MCAQSGEGKSTTVANIIASTIRQISPVTGKVCRVLVITNEEKAEDVYNRITCFSHGWAYTEHHAFTDLQINTFENYIPILAKKITVIDDSFGSKPGCPVSGVTTSIEGIQAIFDNIIANQIHYDAILIDYYQHISTSKKTPELLNKFLINNCSFHSNYIYIKLSFCSII